MLFAHGAQLTERYTLSLDRAFDGLETPSVPHLFNGHFSVLVFWQGQRGRKGAFELRHRSPSGVLGTLPGSIDIGPVGNGRSLISVQQMIFDAYGDHVFEVVVDGQVVFSARLAVLPVV